MSKPRAELALLLVMISILAWPVHSLAAPPIDQLLPERTQFFISSPDLNQLLTRFENSPWGRLWESTELSSFADHIRQHPDTFWARWERDAGTTLDELRGVASGTCALAVVESQGRHSTVVLLQVTGHEDSLKGLLADVEERLGEQGMVAARRSDRGATVDVFKSASGENREQVLYFHKDGILGIADDTSLVTDLLNRWSAAAGGLAENEAYKDVMWRCGPKDADSAADLRWYCDPMLLAQWMRRPDPEEAESEESEVAESARRHGYDAVSGIGGLIYFRADGMEIEHRTSIYAPRPHRGSLRMLSFQRGGDFTPPNWVPNSVSAFSTISIDMANAFQHCHALFDDLYAEGFEGTFQGFLEDLRADDGPQVDVERDLVAYLENRLDLIGWRGEADTNNEQGSIIALRLVDEKEPLVAAAIGRLFRDDPGATAISVDELPYPLWRIGEQAPGLLSSGVIVMQGHLLIAANVEHLHELIRSRQSPLSKDTAFERLSEQLEELNGDEASLKSFSFLDREFAASYEMIRLGSADDSESLYARVIFGLLSAVTRAGTSPLGIDFKKLPKYEAIAHYLGTSGMTGRDHSNGWLLEGVVLPPLAKRSRISP